MQQYPDVSLTHGERLYDSQVLTKRSAAIGCANLSYIAMSMPSDFLFVQR